MPGCWCCTPTPPAGHLAARVEQILSNPEGQLNAWCFDFKVEARWAADAVAAGADGGTSRWLQRPYGDQGLLIQRQLYGAWAATGLWR